MSKINTGKITFKGLAVLLMFSFVASIIGFTVAYCENKNYRALTAKYDEAIEKISDLEISVSSLLTTCVQYTTNDAVYPVEDTTEALTTTFIETTNYSAYITNTQPPKATTAPSTTVNYSKPEETTKAQVTSGTYYVTHSGKKYHVGTCSYLSKSKIAITMDRIKAEGYSPCSRCIK